MTIEDSYMLISLRPTYDMGVKCQSGVIWGHRGDCVQICLQI